MRTKEEIEKILKEYEHKYTKSANEEEFESANWYSGAIEILKWVLEDE